MAIEAAAAATNPVHSFLVLWNTQKGIERKKKKKRLGNLRFGRCVARFSHTRA
jgi:hypothetical protein